MARAEAVQATKLDPKSAVGFRALGWVCQFNEIGIQYAAGFDWDCAAKALKEAVALDADDSNTTANWAVLNEYDAEGERYSANAHLADAIAIFRALKQKDKSFGEQYDDNVLFDLLYSGQYKELLSELETLPASTTRRGLEIAAVVAEEGGSKGVAAGIERANQLSAGSEERPKGLAAAGDHLLHMRMYPESAGILSAAADGQQDAAATAGRIAIIRQMTPWKGSYLPSSDPRSAVQRMYFSYLSGQMNEATENAVLSRHAYSSDAMWEQNVKASEPSHGMLHLMAARSNLPAVVLLDVIVSNTKLSAEGDDDSGYRITMDNLGAKLRQFFVTRENGSYLVVTDGDTPAEAGNQALYLLQQGRDKEAQSLLNWMRERVHKGGGDDPLSGPIFPRFWTQGDAADAKAMKLAACALAVSDPAIKDQLPEIREAWQKAATEDARLNLELLLANGYLTAQDGPHLKEIAGEILKKYPDSNEAIGLMGSAYGMQKEWSEWQEMLDARLSKRPDDKGPAQVESNHGRSARRLGWDARDSANADGQRHGQGGRLQRLWLERAV